MQISNWFSEYFSLTIFLAMYINLITVYNSNKASIILRKVNAHSYHKSACNNWNLPRKESKPSFLPIFPSTCFKPTGAWFTRVLIFIWRKPKNYKIKIVLKQVEGILLDKPQNQLRICLNNDFFSFRPMLILSPKEQPKVQLDLPSMSPNFSLLHLLLRWIAKIW